MNLTQKKKHWSLFALALTASLGVATSACGGDAEPTDDQDTHELSSTTTPPSDETSTPPVSSPVEVGASDTPSVSSTSPVRESRGNPTKNLPQ